MNPIQKPFQLKPRFPAILLFLLAIVLSACSKAPLHYQESFVFGTRVEILVAGLEEARAQSAASAVLREFDRLHRTYHAWLPSELSDLNAALAEGKTLEVTEEMAALLGDAQRRSAQGAGLFDPGVGRLIQAWGFQSSDFAAVLPDPARIADWRNNRTGIAALKIDGRRISSSSRNLAIDLGGYLKGYALDRAASILREQGATNALINIGGNVMALGSKNGTAWSVGIQNPRQPGPLATLKLLDGEAIGTSGDYQRYFEVDGQRYCHLLDPRKGEPVMHTQAVTVLVSQRPAAGTLSDAASKPLFIAGDSWPELAIRQDVDQVLRIDAQGNIEVTPRLRSRLQFTSKPDNLREVALPALQQPASSSESR